MSASTGRTGAVPPTLLRQVAASVHGAVDPSALRAEGVDPGAIVDFSSTQSPLGAAPGVAAAVAGAVVDAYPDPRATVLAEALAARHGVGPEQVVCGNGSTELIRLLAQLALEPGDVALALTPVFGECEVATALAGARLERVPLVHRGPGAGFFCDEPALRDALGRLRPRLCWLCSPNNPTGLALAPALTAALVAGFPETLFVLDEAYCDLLPEPQWERASLAGGNLVVLHSMTKYWGLAGLRLGHAVAAAAVAAALRAAAPPWSVNACAQAAGVVALRELEHHRRSVDLLTTERDRLIAGLRERGWITEPTTAGFFLVYAGDAPTLRRDLLARGCLVRDCSSFGLPRHVRVSPRHPGQSYAAGRAGRNLDLFMMGERAVRDAVAEAGADADVAVIEGVMGLFDGHRDGVTPSSSAAVASLLGAPVVLVIDASRMAASAGALALGFATFDPEVRVAGVILNRWNPRRSREAVQAALARAGVDVLGYVPSAEHLELPSRHLGLVVADELSAEVEAVMERLAEHVEEHVDVDRVLALSAEAPELPAADAAGPAAPVPRPSESSVRPRIAVAWDAAFAFYYADNLALLRAHGAELVHFSPLTAAELPVCDGLYLGGGYPELHARELSENETLRRRLADAVAGGLPVYAECGGLLYLCHTLTDLEGRSWPLVGAVPGRAAMHERLQGMGYREAHLAGDSLLGAAGTAVRGHEFHYSSCELENWRQPAYVHEGSPEGYAAGDLFASYIHLHFAGYPALLEHWLERCRACASAHIGGPSA
jgi:cobyrinic acid a,c-diamide synthase